MNDGEERSRGRVLVVDDRATNRDLLRQELDLADFEVEECSSGRECLEKARTWAPEVVILDVQMPDMDGIHTCRRLKQDPATAAIPVLFLTALSCDDETAVAALGAGGNDFLQKPYSPHILLARVTCQVAIFRAYAKIRAMAMTDELTGVFSRRFLFETMRKELKQLTRTGPTVLSCVMVDVDHFKAINDKFGHLEGDEVLKRIGAILKGAIRGSDIVARFGGEEFALLLPLTPVEGACQLAEKIRLAVERQLRDRFAATVSAGVAASPAADIGAPPTPEASFEAAVQVLLKQADAALYEAKRQGRNRVCRWGG